MSPTRYLLRYPTQKRQSPLGGGLYVDTGASQRDGLACAQLARIIGNAQICQPIRLISICRPSMISLIRPCIVWPSSWEAFRGLLRLM